jgi:protein-arginine kinase activator protein McsA
MEINNLINSQTVDYICNNIINYNFKMNINKMFNENKYFNIIWSLLHLLTVEYPDSPSEKFKQTTVEFIKNINLFSCSSCSNHFYPEENTIINAVQSKKLFIQFLIDYHNNINKYKKNNIYTTDMINDKYKNNDYKLFYKMLYNIDVEEMILNEDFNSIYNKLPDIKTMIYNEKNFEINLTLNT